MTVSPSPNPVAERYTDPDEQAQDWRYHTERVRDGSHALQLLDDVDSIVRFCAANMPDKERYYRGAEAMWRVAYWITALSLPPITAGREEIARVDLIRALLDCEALGEGAEDQEHLEDIADRVADAVLSLTAAPGWRLVPVEPTEEMLNAADEPFHAEWRNQQAFNVRCGRDKNVGFASGSFSEAIYTAMLAASPQPLLGSGKGLGSLAVPTDDVGRIDLAGAISRVFDPEAFEKEPGPRGLPTLKPTMVSRRITAMEKADAVLALLGGGEGLGSRAVPVQEHPPEQGFKVPEPTPDQREYLDRVFADAARPVDMSVVVGGPRQAKPTTSEPSSMGRRENQDPPPYQTAYTAGEKDRER